MAAAEATEKKAAAQAAAAAAESGSERRARLFEVARVSLDPTFAAVREALINAAPQVGTDFPFELDGVNFDIDKPEKTKQAVAGPRRLAFPFDVIAFAAVGVRQPPDRWDYTGRSHGLWYCDAKVVGEYRWFETAFMYGAFSQKRGRSDPYRPKSSKRRHRCSPGASHGGTEHQVAWPFTAVDQGAHAEFVERWIEWFGKAATGGLHRPSTMPDRDPSNSWHRS